MNKKGFTLIELLATIVILSIVIGIVIVSVNGIVETSKEKSDTITRENIMEAAVSYMVESETNNTFVNNLIKNYDNDCNKDNSCSSRVRDSISNFYSFDFYVSVIKLSDEGFIELKNDKYDNYCVTIKKNAETFKITNKELTKCENVTNSYICGQETNHGIMCDAYEDGIIDYRDGIETLKASVKIPGANYNSANADVVDPTDPVEVTPGDALYILRYVYLKENMSFPSN